MASVRGPPLRHACVREFVGRTVEVHPTNTVGRCAVVVGYPYCTGRRLGPDDSTERDDMTLTVGTPIYRRDGTYQASISQSAAATADTLVADPGDGYRVQLISFIGTMDADGTVTFLSGAATMTGAMDVAGKTGVAWRGTKQSPFLECESSEALKVTTTAGALRGTIVYKVVPKP